LIFPRRVIAGGQARQSVAEALRSVYVGNSDPLEDARSEAKRGNPFPLIAMQWPELVITDPEIAEKFEGKLGDDADPCLRIDDWQRGIFAAAFDVTVGEIAVKGCTGAGKGFTGGILINLFFDVFNPSRINITSQTFRHAQQNLFGEASMWFKRMRHPCVKMENCTSQTIKDSERHYVAVLNPSPSGQGESFSGMHTADGPTIYFWDEASATRRIDYENALKNARKMISFSNPRVTEGMFRDLYRPMQGEGTKEERYERENTTGYCVGNLGRRYCVTVPGDACTNVKYGLLKAPVAPPRGITIGERFYKPAELIPEEDFDKVRAIVPGQIDTQQYQSILDMSKEKWEVECFALARFPSENPTRQVILSSWLDRHVRDWNDHIPVTCFGLDVARSKSGDETMLAAGGIKGVRDLIGWVDDNNTRHVQKILKTVKQRYGIDLRDGENHVCVDMGGGYGGGVLDVLEQMGVWVIQFQPAGRPIVYPGRYANQRAEWYMLLSRRFDPSDNWQGYTWAIPNDEKLIEELTAPIKHLASNGTSWIIEPKDGIKERLGRSPDRADSTVCLWRAVFDKHDLLDKMNERVNNPLMSSEYTSDGETRNREEGKPDDDADFEIPTPNLVEDGGNVVENLLDAFGMHTQDEPDDPWRRYFE
jgi:hypothetical protein